MDVPSTAAGIVRQFKVQKGGRVSQGDLIAIVEAETAGEPAGPLQLPLLPMLRAVRRPGGTSAAPAPQSAPAPAIAAPARPRRARLRASPSRDSRARTRAHRSGASRANSAWTSPRSTGTGIKGRITEQDVKAHVKRLLTEPVARGGAAEGPRGRLRGVRSHRAPAALAHPEDSRPAPACELGQHPARHPVRRSRHHRDGGNPREAEGPGDGPWHQAHAARLRHACMRAGTAGIPAFRRVARCRRRRTRVQEVRASRLRGGHAGWTGRAGGARRRSQGRLRARARTRRR